MIIELSIFLPVKVVEIVRVVAIAAVALMVRVYITSSSMLFKTSTKFNGIIEVVATPNATVGSSSEKIIAPVSGF
ncbi:hypothetical protein SAMN05443252_1156 [Bacillus sp. OV322]|uniref:hypothetical protein n=1 Tax=Bacillus sp. OV322 TaxID=1882764 RepID=UPI0008EAFD85|nr:hypothetical protein [Bacillus sp. OV322]SFD02616.1 hypothetical protein SAMN05443252_1156 [Bacillus sp. OV322]